MNIFNGDFQGMIWQRCMQAVRSCHTSVHYVRFIINYLFHKLSLIFAHITPHFMFLITHYYYKISL
ncbi:hypothetical protein DBV15_11779 [Temnothorax longispinosus]|uniref:Uncharacterized protein n=1 Tax=Temnothorax longispinosus TaxID=300112 RepID=A0A4S2KA67_9HYME|nr:hypothetical protein DBV15_11779 [Temnothorax longispinosus]